MPITPFHYPIARIIHRLDGKLSLSLPALIVGSMVPDIEVPFLSSLIGTQDRLILHSFIGGLTFGTIIAVALTVFVYAPLINAVFSVNKERLKQKCSFSRVVVFSSLIGNPLFWPFLTMYQTPSFIVPLLGGASMASLIVHGSMIILFSGLCLAYRDNLWEQLLVG